MTSKTMLVAIVLTAVVLGALTGVLFELGQTSTQANIESYVAFVNGN